MRIEVRNFSATTTGGFSNPTLALEILFWSAGAYNAKNDQVKYPKLTESAFSILNQIKETYESGNALHFSNTDEVLVINQNNKPYIQIKNPNKRGKYENK